MQNEEILSPPDLARQCIVAVGLIHLAIGQNFGWFGYTTEKDNIPKGVINKEDGLRRFKPGDVPRVDLNAAEAELHRAVNAALPLYAKHGADETPIFRLMDECRDIVPLALALPNMAKTKAQKAAATRSADKFSLTVAKAQTSLQIVEQRAGRVQSAPPQNTIILEDVDLWILDVYANRKTSITQAVLLSALDKKFETTSSPVSNRSLTDRLKKLRLYGFIARPDGKKQKDYITEAGLEYLEKHPAPPPPMLDR